MSISSKQLNPQMVMGTIKLLRGHFRSCNTWIA